MSSLTRGWAYWREGRIIVPCTNYIHENVPMARREELSDYNQPEKWPLGPNGQPKDPWTPDSRGAFYRVADGAECTFISPSWGGIHAFRRLCNAYADGKVNHPDPDDMPIVAIDITYRVSKDYGRIVEPMFPIVDWGTRRDLAAQHNGGPKKLQGGNAAESELPESAAAKAAMAAAKARSAKR